jgi:hypothetical protein
MGRYLTAGLKTRRYDRSPTARLKPRATLALLTARLEAARYARCGGGYVRYRAGCDFISS